MKTLLTLSAILMAGQILAEEPAKTYKDPFIGELSVEKKDNLAGISFKVQFLKVEYLEGDSELVFNSASEHIQKKRTEVNLAIEPDFQIMQHQKFTLEISPLVGFSAKQTKELHESKVGSACDISGGQIPAPECFSTRTENEAKIIQGASLKFQIEPDSQLKFFFKAGAYSNDDKLNYRPQFAIGASMPF